MAFTKVSNAGTVYNYEYDSWGRNSKVEIAGQMYAEARHNLYESFTEYANKDKVTVTKDKFGNPIIQLTEFFNKETQEFDKSEQIVNHYDDLQNVKSVNVDMGNNECYNIKYQRDYKGNITSETRTRNSKKELVKEYKYNVDNELESTTYTVNEGKPLTYTYGTDRTPDKRDAKVGLPLGLNQVLAYDGLGRTHEIALGGNLVKDIYYAKYGDHATNRINSVWYGLNGIRKDNTKYTYDKAGNIETVSENGKLVARYRYDGLNRLVREDNVKFGTFTYQYDVAGNILSKTEYAYTLSDVLGQEVDNKEYSYNQHGWKDQLLSFNGEHCQYDVIGNPVYYRDRTLAWQGRRLLRYGHDEYYADYTYDVDGMRTSKHAVTQLGIFNSKYFYDGSNLVAEQRNGEWLYYLYGVDGVVGFRYNGEVYLFRKNVQGDITHIYKQLSDNSLEQVAQYVYDAWGNTQKLQDDEGIATINPFRYRSYYFDEETGLYYLQSRYYDSELGRFISADSLEYLDPETLGGLNLYSYCGNNPVMGVDPEGTINWNAILKIVCSVVIVVGLITAAALTGGAILIGAAIGATVGMVLGAATGIRDSVEQGGNWLDNIAGGMFSGTITGALSGALAATSFGVGVQILGNMAINTGEYLLSSLIDNETPTWEGFIDSAVVGFVAGFFGGNGAMFGEPKLLTSIFRESARNFSKVFVPIITSSLAGYVASILQYLSRITGLRELFKKKSRR